MKNKPLIITAVAAIILAGAGSYTYSNRLSHNDMNNPMSSTGHSMAMTNLLKAQTGDAYDKMFIVMMSEHHAGAVAMAKLVEKDGKHAAVRLLATNIIAAQTKELADMKLWSANWGYAYSEPDSGAVAAMTVNMRGLSGDELDQQFLSEMTAHHNDAIDMAVLSPTRANHEEIKALSVNVISSQSTEIFEMKQLMSDYGYESGDMMDHNGGHM